MKHDVSKTEYGNWVSLSLLKTITLLVVVFAVTTFVSFLPYVNDLMPGAALLWLLRALSAILLCLSVWALAVFRKAHHIFSYSGGRLSAKVISYVAGHVRCEGRVRVLDIGCGSGANIKYAASLGYNVYGIDISQTAVDYCIKSFDSTGLYGNIQVASVDNMPFKDTFFHIVIDHGVLVCVNEEIYKKAIDEVHRVLVGGGGLLY